MTTIVRVKRHRAEDPVEALVLSCKRKKTEESDSDPALLEKIFNFSGTVEDKDDKVATSTVQSYNKDSKCANFKKNHVPEIKAKLRQERKEKSDKNRFTLLSCLRSSNDVENPVAGAKDNFTIVDVNKETDEKFSEQGLPEGSYVYDLYSIQEGDSDFNDIYYENLLGIQPLVSDFEYRTGEDCYEEIDPEEDDSNDENNWRNDYPDSDSEMDDGDADLLSKQLKHCKLDNDYELSEDSGEEDYLNLEDNDNYYYYEAEDLAGKRYAKYKANAMKQMMVDDVGADADNDVDDDDEDFVDCEGFSYYENSD